MNDERRTIFSLPKYTSQRERILHGVPTTPVLKKDKYNGFIEPFSGNDQWL